MSVQWWETFGAVVGVVVAMIVAAVGATWWSARAARAAADDLYDRLKENDFKHLEDRLSQLDNRVGRVEERLTDRMDRVEKRLSNRMEEGFRVLKTLIQGTGAS